MSARAVRTAAAVALLMGAATSLFAQTCAGAMSFNFAPLQLGGTPEWSRGGGSAAVSVAAGSDRLFSALSTGVTFADADERITHAELAVGADQPLTVDNRLHLCPVATLSYARGGESWVAAGGYVAAGWIARNAAALTIVPSAGIGVRRRPDALDHSAELQVAIGFILRGRAALTPRVTFARRRPATVALELTIDAR